MLKLNETDVKILLYNILEAISEHNEEKCNCGFNFWGTIYEIKEFLGEEIEI
jgi:hypothetical protein